jgi:hypothetical protein
MRQVTWLYSFSFIAFLFVVLPGNFSVPVFLRDQKSSVNRRSRSPFGRKYCAILQIALPGVNFVEPAVSRILEW